MHSGHARRHVRETRFVHYSPHTIHMYFVCWSWAGIFEKEHFIMLGVAHSKRTDRKSIVNKPYQVKDYMKRTALVEI